MRRQKASNVQKNIRNVVITVLPGALLCLQIGIFSCSGSKVHIGMPKAIFGLEIANPMLRYLYRWQRA